MHRRTVAPLAASACAAAAPVEVQFAKRFNPTKLIAPRTPFPDNSMSNIDASKSSASSPDAASVLPSERLPVASADGAVAPALQAPPAVDSSGTSQAKQAVKAGPTLEDFIAAGCVMSCPCHCIYCSK